MIDFPNSPANGDVFTSGNSSWAWNAATSQWRTALIALNPKVQRFSGNGSTTQFTLNSVPPSVNFLDVYITGAYQQKDTYTVANNIITFSEAPPTGTENIEVEWGSTLDIGMPSDNSVSTIKLQDASVTTAKLGLASVTPSRLSAGAPTWETDGRFIIGSLTSVGDPVGRLQVWENTNSGAYVGIDIRSGRADSVNGLRGLVTTLIEGSGANSGNSGNAAIKYHHNDNYNLSGDLSFWTKDNTNTQIMRMRIYYNGDIYSYGNTYIRNLQITQSGNDIYFTNASAGGLRYQSDEGGHIFQTWTSSAWRNILTMVDGGNILLNHDGYGNTYARAAGAYANITDLGGVAPIQVLETGTGTNSWRYIPIISGTSTSASGYRQHTVFGSYRADTWANAFIAVGGNDSYPTRAFYFNVNGNFSADGTIYGATKSFKIPHPLPELEETHDLVHISVEAPQADLIYRGVVKLLAGRAEVNIDLVAGMTEGTFIALCREVQCFTTNETDWTAVKGSVSENILTIEAQDKTSTSTISWMVIGERQDKFMLDTGSTDDNGKLIVEPLRTLQPEVDPNYELQPAPNLE